MKNIPPKGSSPLPSAVRRRTLPLMVFSQFAGTSLWFASNGVMGDLQAAFALPGSALGHLTSAVQLGFIAGTLVFALLTLADRFSPSRLFFWSALLGAACNLGMAWGGNSLWTLVALRCATGFFLAGIYPVGMKIVADYFDRGLGASLGYLVGALVLGTAFPHLLRGAPGEMPWQGILGATSALAALGGVLVLSLPDGPYRKPMQIPDPAAFLKVFGTRGFRRAAFGYFGHMWELYAFWAFVPILLQTYKAMHPGAGFGISLWSFLAIGAGGPACVLGGYLSRGLGEERVARAALILSGCCCLLCPWALYWDSTGLFLAFLVFWGMVVIADSPLFSSLVARNAPAEQRGTALTIVTCIGFAITIVSIEMLGGLLGNLQTPLSFLVLALGPALSSRVLGKDK
ncbi:MFS transporter [Robiginitalea marina]|uniref:MFS transporter n=1 Tax=Robiginitalea marina TaxID=2954105 RepID=A0ABT1B2B0_9FLAO|nr:MFS transporter [Robiginitalea marina]MCO5725753.1 MFS transporter [Robiginitalea marina]